MTAERNGRRVRRSYRLGESTWPKDVLDEARRLVGKHLGVPTRC
jgi:hypothetical protein